jgi:hypothetical protein
MQETENANAEVDTSEGEKPAAKKQKAMSSVRKRLPLAFNL